MIVVGKRAGSHLLRITLDALHSDLGELGISLRELRLEVGEDAEKIVTVKNAVDYIESKKK